MRYEEFARWFTGSFLILFSIATYVWRYRFARGVCDVPRRGLDDVASQRVTAAANRRRQFEGILPAAWGFWSLGSIVFGVLTLANVLSPMVAYALMCVSGAAAIGYGYLHIRNTGERRAAVLQPRRLSSTIPAFWYVLGVVISLLPLTYVSVPSMRWSAVLVSLSALATVAIALRASGMAALLTGDDPDAEAYVERHVRKSRIGGVLSLAYAQSYFFCTIAQPMVPDAQYRSVAVTVSFVLFFSFMIWIVFGRFFAKKITLPPPEAAVHRHA